MSRILYEGAQAERKVSVFDPACAYDFKLEKTKDESVLLKKKEVKAAIANGTEISCSVKLTNTDRIMQDTFWVGVYPGMTDEKIDYMAKVIKEGLLQ